MGVVSQKLAQRVKEFYQNVEKEQCPGITIII